MANSAEWMAFKTQCRGVYLTTEPESDENLLNSRCTETSVECKGTLRFTEILNLSFYFHLSSFQGLQGNEAAWLRVEGCFTVPC